MKSHPPIVLDPQYRILAATTAYQRQFGVATEPPVGRKCYKTSHHYDVPCDQAWCVIAIVFAQALIVSSNAAG